MPSRFQVEASQGAGFVELFFDLVFVFAVTQITGELAHDLTWSGLGHALVVFWLVWWAWTQFTWSLNEADTDHTVIRLLTLAATASAFFMALTVPLVTEIGGALFAVAYLIVRFIGLWLQRILASGDDAWAEAVRKWVLTSSLGLLAVIVSIFVPGETRMAVLAVAAGLDVIAAIRAGREEWRLLAAHFAERHALFVIIVLGESLIVAGATALDNELGSSDLVVTGLAVLITVGLWWTYFASAKDTCEEAMDGQPERRLGGYARDVYSFGHVPIIGGVIAFAAGLESGLLHGDEPLGPAGIAIGAGVALFVGGTGLVMLRAGTRIGWPRWVGFVVILGSIPFLTGLAPSPALILIAVVVLAVAVAEPRGAITVASQSR
ncbi:MAG: hypothetical protein GEU79_06765 [Acidimicrobiia bacterium]|nr:hypothetical protein [Acidimicrobiia bacterium]